VFILVNNNIIATEQVQYITKCEIEWIKIKLKDAKDLLIGAFYMPHKNIHVWFCVHVCYYYGMI
jgi:hypothetical protein